MAISGIGVIESGLDGFRPILLPQKYSGYTPIYDLPFPTDSDIATKKGGAVSASETLKHNKIIENQLVGISRTHTPAATGGTVVFQGVYTNKSSHPLNSLIVSVSGISALKNNIYMGDVAKEYVWSGLSNTGVNYLWLSVVEQLNTLPGYQSSRQYRDWEARSTNSLDNPPNVPEGSVLVATFLSGVGINDNPYGITKFIPVVDHVNNNQNPHGLLLNQDQMLISGITVLDSSIWNSNLSGAGLNSGLTFYSVQYLNSLTQFGNLICSGILGNVFSGNTSGSIFQNMVNLSVDPGTIGFLTICSGLNVSGSIFHNFMKVNSGISIDTIDLDSLQHLISQTSLSGSSFQGIPLHTHFKGYPAQSNVIEPKYPGMVVFPQGSTGRRADKVWEYNTDLGPYLPTLRHKLAAQGLVYIRQYIPYGYNKIDSIQITNKIDPGCPASTVAVRDCIGTSLIPKLGNALTSSGMIVTTVSGFSQAGFSHLMPFDVEITLNSTSGLSQYLGSIKTNFIAQN